MPGPTRGPDLLFDEAMADCWLRLRNAGNALADRVRRTGLNGIVYPAVRHPAGTALVAQHPGAVQSPAQGRVIALEWQGSPDYSWGPLTD